MPAKNTVVIRGGKELPTQHAKKSVARRIDKKGFVWKYVAPFFMSTTNGDPDDKFRIKPLYFWSTVFLSLTVLAVIVQIGVVVFSFAQGKKVELNLATTIAVLGGMVIGLITNYNFGKKNGLAEQAQSYSAVPPKEGTPEQEYKGNVHV